MKKLYLFFALSLLAYSTAFSQSNKKLVIMVTRANWCPSCRANEDKINNELIPAFSGSKEVAIVINDVTNKRTRARSKPVLQSAGVYDISLNQQATGVVTIINASSGKIVNRFYVSYSLDKMKKIINDALSGI